MGRLPLGPRRVPRAERLALLGLAFGFDLLLDLDAGHRRHLVAAVGAEPRRVATARDEAREVAVLALPRDWRLERRLVEFHPVCPPLLHSHLSVPLPDSYLSYRPASETGRSTRVSA